VPIAGDREIAEGVARARGDIRRSGISFFSSGKAQIGGPLNPESIAPIFKRVAHWIGMPERLVNRVSGHSTRVEIWLPWTLTWRRLRRRGLEVDAHAAAVCGKDQCGEVGDGEGSRKDRKE
jgi:hypothetical protein